MKVIGVNFFETHCISYAVYGELTTADTLL